MRLTTDAPTNNIEMAFNLFYVKDKEVWVRGYGKGGTDISLFELSRNMVRQNIPSVDLGISDDSYSMMMVEWLWEDLDTAEHIIALLYQAGWVCAELREHLKRFEDTEPAAEVVRCRDCKWYQEGELLAPNKFCFRLKHPEEDRKIGYNYAPDDFCSYGERKGGQAPQREDV